LRGGLAGKSVCSEKEPYLGDVRWCKYRKNESHRRPQNAGPRAETLLGILKPEWPTNSATSRRWERREQAAKMAIFVVKKGGGRRSGRNQTDLSGRLNWSNGSAGKKKCCPSITPSTERENWGRMRVRGMEGSKGREWKHVREVLTRDARQASRPMRLR